MLFDSVLRLLCLNKMLLLLCINIILSSGVTSGRIKEIQERSYRKCLLFIYDIVEQYYVKYYDDYLENEKIDINIGTGNIFRICTLPIGSKTNRRYNIYILL